ncbi:hypothetical protein OAX78_04230, partial [Planctomycetota bacterium]|nr:hypothetical protein [Planctomycetota bacterium]
GSEGDLRLNGGSPNERQAFTGLGAFASLMNSEQLVETQRHAKRCFLQAVSTTDFERCVDLYRWLVATTEPFANGTSGDTAGLEDHDVALRRSVHTTAALELRRLAQGLDYFGNRRNWAPMFRVAYLDTHLGKVIQMGKIIEEEFRNYVEQDQRTLAKVNAFFEKLTEYETQRQSLGTEEEALRTHLEGMLGEAEELAAAIHGQQLIVRDNAAAFTVAFQTKRSIDFWFTLFDALITLGTSAYTVYGGITAGIKLFKDFKAWEGTQTAFMELKDTEKAIKAVTAVKGALKDIDKVWAKTKDDFAALGLPEDAVKLVVERDEFEKAIKPYLDEFDEAGELKSSVLRLLDLTQARNGLLLDFTGAVTRLGLLIQERAQVAAEQEQIKRLRAAAEADRVPDSIMTYMGSAYDRAREWFVEGFYQLERAAYYELGAPPQGDYSEANVATIASVYLEQQELLKKYREHLARDPGDLTKDVVLERKTDPLAFGELKNTGVLRFRIAPGHPAFVNYRNVKIHKVTLAVPDVSATEGNLYLPITISGESLVGSPLHPDDAPTEFVLPTRQTSFDRNLATGKVEAAGQIFRPDGNYTALSPFANWAIDFRRHQGSGSPLIDLDTITRIELTFEGTGYGV